MLIYRNRGPRRYHDQPVPPGPRQGWEFQAILSGECALDLEGAKSVRVSQCLLVFRPETVHGWSAADRTPCEIAVVHFDRVPSELDRAVLPGGWLQCGLQPDTLGRIDNAVATLTRQRPDDGLYDLRSDALLIELTLLQLEQVKLPPVHEQHAHRLATHALAWYSEHLADRPSVADAADALAVSPGQLRRLFRQAGMGSPAKRFAAIRCERARQLIERTDYPMKRVAGLCGYASQSDMCRAFRREGVHPPARFRARTLGP